MSKNLDHYPKIISGTRKDLIIVRIWLSIVWFLLRKYKSPKKIRKIVKRVNEIKNRYTVENSYKKLAYVDGRYYFNMNNNGWPSPYFNRFIDMEAKDVLEQNVGYFENLRMVLIALTKKCPLNCEHCYEGEELNKKDTLTLEDHKKILKKVQDAGISLIQYGGGDPMAKVDFLEELLLSKTKEADFWIYTSGFNFTEKNAMRLKKAGLTGVSFSLDHHLPERHNQFRRNNSVYDWVVKGTENARKAQLVIGMSVCVTREYANQEDLLSYLKLAKQLGASFVQLLEPRVAGNWEGHDVLLLPKHEQEIERFFLDVNENPKYKDMPIVLSPGYHQRKQGCPAAGSRYLYIDTDGYLNSCPFCRNKKTHVLGPDYEKSIMEIKNEGCDRYEFLN